MNMKAKNLRDLNVKRLMLEAGISLNDIVKYMEVNMDRKLTASTVRSCIIGRTNQPWIREAIQELLGKKSNEVWVEDPSINMERKLKERREPGEIEIRVKEIMRNRGMTMADIARYGRDKYKRSVSRSAVWNVVTGKSNSFMIQQMIREALAVDKPDNGNWI